VARRGSDVKRTPEQKAAYETLAEAVTAALKLQPDWQGPDQEGLPVVVDWILVAEGMRWTQEGDEEECWHVLTPNGTIRSTVALGLLEIGKAMMMDQDDREL
jgi:hypothetical protein